MNNVRFFMPTPSRLGKQIRLDKMVSMSWNLGLCIYTCLECEETKLSLNSCVWHPLLRTRGFFFFKNATQRVYHQYKKEGPEGQLQHRTSGYNATRVAQKHKNPYVASSNPLANMAANDGAHRPALAQRTNSSRML